MGKCIEFKDLIHGYLDNELSVEELDRLKNHLNRCADCQKAVELFRGLKITLPQKISYVPTPVSLMDKILKEETSAVPVRSAWLFPRWAVALVSLVIISTGIIFYQQTNTPAHFLVVHTADRIQTHLDRCPECQKNTAKTIKEHLKMVSATQKQLQKHLDNCPDCQNKIVKTVEGCKGYVLGSIFPRAVRYG